MPPYLKLRALREKDEGAVNEMVSRIACGVHAGNPEISSESASRLALETAEGILAGLELDETHDQGYRNMCRQRHAASGS